MQNRREAASLLLGAGAAAVAGGSLGAPSTRGRTVVIEARPEPLIFNLRRSAILVIDMQNAFGARGGMFDRAGIDIAGIRAVVPAVQSAVAAGRRARLPIVYLKMGFQPDLRDAGPSKGPNLLKHALFHVGQAVPAPDGRPNRILIRDTWDTEIIPELRPRPSDLVLYKTRYSGFVGTTLDDEFRRRGIDTLIVTGCTTSVCVESTVRDAFFRNYRCIVLEDCAAEPIGATAVRSNHEASLLSMQVSFGWISNSKELGQALTLA